MSKLEERKYKNWAEICLVNGWKTIGGTYKKARQREMNSICQWHKIEGSNEIIVKKIYNVAKIENKLSSSKIIANIQLLILDMLVTSEENKCIITMRNMMRLFKIVNNNYMYEIEDIAKTLNIDKDIVADAMSIINQTGRDHIERSLKGLERKGVIIYDKITLFNKIIYKPKVDQQGNYVYNNGNIVQVSTGEIEYNYIPNDEELDQFEKIKSGVMKSLGISNLGKVYSGKYPSLTKDFYSKLNFELKTKMNVHRSYKSYRLIYDYDEIIKELSIRKLKTIQGFVNTTIIDKCRKCIDNVKADTTELEDYDKFKQEYIDAIDDDEIFEALYSHDIKDVQAKSIEEYIESKGIRARESYETDAKRVIYATMTTETRLKIRCSKPLWM